VLVKWSDEEVVDLIVTTGGTGLSPRDVTPEATLAVVDRTVPGMAEAMRAESMKITPHAMISRAVAGVRHGSLIVNLPGSPKAVKESLEAVLDLVPHALDMMEGGGH
jgi:molybdenum cofactor synthesis domain-containing protein